MATYEIPEGKELWKTLRASLWTLLIALAVMAFFMPEFVQGIPVIGGFSGFLILGGLLVALYPFIRKRWP